MKDSGCFSVDMLFPTQAHVTSNSIFVSKLSDFCNFNVVEDGRSLHGNFHHPETVLFTSETVEIEVIPPYTPQTSKI